MTITIQVDKNRLVTLDEIMTDTCWEREAVAATLPHDPCTVAEFLALESVPPSERIYHAARFIDPRVAREFACRITSTTAWTAATAWAEAATAWAEAAEAAAWAAFVAEKAAWEAAGRTAWEAAWGAAWAGRAASWNDSLAILRAMVEQVDRDGTLTVEEEMR